MNLIVVDFEATCWNPKRTDILQEIIEFGCVKANVETFETLETLDILVKPVVAPELSGFCTELTTITQEMIDKEGISFQEAYKKFSEFVDKDDIFVSWGAFDKNILMSNCKYFKCKYPFNSIHIDVKRLISRIKKWGRRGCGLTTAMNKLDLKFQGQQHRGIDDAKNVLSVIKEVSLGMSTGEIPLTEEFKSLAKRIW